MRIDGTRVLALGWRSHRAWWINYFCDERVGQTYDFWNLDDGENGVALKRKWKVAKRTWLGMECGVGFEVLVEREPRRMLTWALWEAGTMVLELWRWGFGALALYWLLDLYWWLVRGWACPGGELPFGNGKKWVEIWMKNWTSYKQFKVSYWLFGVKCLILQINQLFIRIEE